MASYRAKVGIDYPPNKRVEAGEIVSDLPPQSVKWLLEMELIEDSSKPAKKIEEPKVEEPVKAEEPIAEPVVEKAEESFDANAEDTDGDGFVQDGTPFQRPVEEK